MSMGVMALIRSGLTTCSPCNSRLAQTCPGDSQPGQEQVLPAQGAMLIGVDYYPEHWPKERWELDIRSQASG